MSTYRGLSSVDFSFRGSVLLKNPTETHSSSRSGKCFSKTSLRRIIRIFYLILIIAALVALPSFIIYKKLGRKIVELDTSSLIEITQNNCKLNIEQDNSIALNKAHFTLEVPGKKTKNPKIHRRRLHS
jgi:hypothetical protein